MQGNMRLIFPTPRSSIFVLVASPDKLDANRSFPGDC